MLDLVENPEDWFSHNEAHMSCVSGVSDQAQHKLGCSTTEDGYGLQISDKERRGIVQSMYRKRKALISCTVLCFFICEKQVFS